MSLYPNPAGSTTFLSANLNENSDVRVSIYQINGALVASKNYGRLSGTLNLPIDTEGLNAGIYFVNVLINEKSSTLKLIIN